MGIEQIRRAASEMEKVVQQNALNSDELASTSGDMKSQAESVQRLVVALMDLLGTSRGLEEAVNDKS